MNAFLYIAQLLALLGFTGVGVYAAARFIGLGQCMTCESKTWPWNAYCQRHSPCDDKEDDGAPAQ